MTREGSGRRLGDQWLERGVRAAALIAALAAALGVILSGVNAVALGQTTAKTVSALGLRVDSLANASAATAYMTCVNFSETHPASQVPVFCNTATRTK